MPTKRIQRRVLRLLDQIEKAADQRARAEVDELTLAALALDPDNAEGTHVVMASCIASQADGGEVLISALPRELVAASGEFALEAREPVALKGLDGEYVTWRWHSRGSTAST